MRALGRELPEEHIRAMMDAVDTDKSGEIDFDEFKVMMENFKNQHRLNDDRLDFYELRSYELTRGRVRRVVVPAALPRILP